MAPFCDRSTHVPEGLLTGSDNTEAISHGVYDAYKFLFMVKSGGSANKSFRYQPANAPGYKYVGVLLTGCATGRTVVECP